MASIAQQFPVPGAASNISLFVVSTVLIAFAVVAIHELGHILAGLAVGFRFNTMRIGPFQFDRPFRISRYRGPGAWTGGGASLLPGNTDNLALHAVIMIAAGPVANILTGSALLFVPYSKGYFSWVFITCSMIGGVGELLIPFRTPFLVSDASRIWMLLRNRQSGERWLAIIKLGTELNEGVMPESLSAEFLAKAVAVCDLSPDTVTAYALAYSAAFHRHNDAEAAQALETCLQFSSCVAPVIREALMSDAAVFQARKRKRVDLAEQWLASMPQTTQRPGLRSRVQAGILEAQGDCQGALKKLDEVEKAAHTLPNQAQRELSLRFLRRWQSDLRGS
ncbi:MAG TPA: site-2 protease family protein [Candidatus Acidoferrum sp.]|nr:site-2 protease family protein [Candidatus Acidoferrum sp.]